MPESISTPLIGANEMKDIIITKRKNVIADVSTGSESIGGSIMIKKKIVANPGSGSTICVKKDMGVFLVLNSRKYFYWKYQRA